MANQQPRRAALLSGAAQALREALGVPLKAVQMADQQRTVHDIRAALVGESFAAAWAERRALELEEAMALALEGKLSPGP